MDSVFTKTVRPLNKLLYKLQAYCWHVSCMLMKQALFSFLLFQSSFPLSLSSLPFFTCLCSNFLLSYTAILKDMLPDSMFLCSKTLRLKMRKTFVMILKGCSRQWRWLASSLQPRNSTWIGGNVLFIICNASKTWVSFPFFTQSWLQSLNLSELQQRDFWRHKKPIYLYIQWADVAVY